jgi:molybdenum cofactor synthesis domain-containing protein
MKKQDDDHSEEEHTHYHGVDRAEAHIHVDDAQSLFLKNLSQTKPEFVKLKDAKERVLFEDFKSPINLPQMARSTRDGFALHLKDDGETRTYSIVGNVRIGVVPRISIASGEAVYIATGSFLPKGANSVVMKEYASVEGSSVLVNKAPKKSDNILEVGSDIEKGKVILKKGTMIRAQHIALLSMLGVEKIKVFKKPRIAYFSTGDELVDPGKSSRDFGIFDGTRPFLESSLATLGAEPIDLGIAKDDFGQIRHKMRLGLVNYDGLILSAGSSVGEKDYVGRAADSIKEVKILVHGVAMRPSSPTGLAVYKRKPLILLPGFPTSAIVSFFVFVAPTIAAMAGAQTSDHIPSINVRLADDYEGKKGVKHYVRVKVSKKGGEYVANIVRPTEAQYSKWLGEANAIAIVDEESSPVARGDILPAILIGKSA